MHRLDALEQAKSLSLAGDYASALRLIEQVLELDPKDIDALRLKGNVIELEIMDREANQPTKFLYSVEVGRARACYERILLLDPSHVGALVDLGAHWKNRGEMAKALEYFDKALQLYEKNVPADHESIVEAMEAKLEILREGDDSAAIGALEQKLQGIRSPTD